MYELKSNFYPAHEPKAGYIGKADLTVADSIRINGISVFKKDDGYNIQFTEWAEGKSYVVPHSADAHAAILGVIVKAIESDKHFAVAQGKVALRMKDYEDKKKEVTLEGRSVSEKYADARYNLTIEGLCTLYGITSKYTTFEQDGQKRGFVAVDMPRQIDSEGKVKMYKSADGKEHAALVFEAVECKIKDKDGKESVIDYGDKIADAVRSEHNNLRKQSLDGQVAEAKETGKKSATKKKENKTTEKTKTTKKKEEPAR